MRDEMVVLYTWQDVERCLLLDKVNWPQEWLGVEVFSRELIVYMNLVTAETKENANRYLKQLFKQYYANEAIKIVITQTEMTVVWEKMEAYEASNKLPLPLFKEFLYVNDESNPSLNELPGVPVTAFHSYKGGVGRTLSLITFVRDMIQEFGNKKKVLIVDSDIEAPGLTWLGQEQNGGVSISYLDILSIIGAKGDEDEILENVSREIEKYTLTFQTERMEIAQYFLPTYRKEEQLFDIYANPERIMVGESNKYIIVDVLSKIGKFLNVDMVLVDLRAGISEYSAPFLFDPRVSKLIATSTSNQSVYGTQLLLHQMGKQKGNGVTNILLTMVMRDTFKGRERDEVYEKLLKEECSIREDASTDPIKLVDDIIEIEKSDRMIHLGNLKQICENLNGESRMTIPMYGIVKEMFRDHAEGCVREYSETEIEAFRQNLNKIASENVTAEGSDVSNLLATKPVKQLGNFVREVPKISVLGAKGAGKTYLYKQLLASKNWENFLSILDEKSQMQGETLICPMLASEDRRMFQALLAESINYCKDGLPALKLEKTFLTQHEENVKDAIQMLHSEKEWKQFWNDMIIGMFENMDSLEMLDDYLQKQNKRMVLLIDGLETLFQNVMNAETQKNAIVALCKGLLNYIYESQFDNIGVIIFIRKDITELAMGVNFNQFRSQYQQYELNWSQKDALQLAWKLANRAAMESNISWAENDEAFVNDSQAVLEEKLTRIWGRKMGPDHSKTAITVRWVLASLSDFNGQLQARDIVRFLKFATDDKTRVNTQYFDRLLNPDSMKQAIKDCSDEKLNEVEQEIHQLKAVFRVLQEVEQKDKQVPLNETVLDKLRPEERKALERYGYLKEADGEYYIPESVRYALGYNKSRRGGIKLVSLLVSK